MTQHPDIFAALAAPFTGENEVKQFSKSGKVFRFVNARTVMNRLDDVMGPEGWRDEYHETREGLRCRISLLLPGATEWVYKEDGGGAAGMDDGDDDEKSMFSSAFKRAAVKWGIARYLYRDGVPAFVRERYEAGKNGSQRSLPSPPPTPEADATPPRKERREWPSAGTPPANGDAPGRNAGGNPRTGKGLFQWVRDQEKAGAEGLLAHLDQWARERGYPARLVQLNPQQIAIALAEARGWIAALESQEVPS